MSQPVETQDTVRRTISVPATPEQAFHVFTEQFGTWWPSEYSLGDMDMLDLVIEPVTGGRWYEVGVDGTEFEAGLVTAYESPDRLVLAWHLDVDWRYDPNPAHASEVEACFFAQGTGVTRVELEHRHFERHGADATAVRTAVDSPQGWDRCLACYVDLFAN